MTTFKGGLSSLLDFADFQPFWTKTTGDKNWVLEANCKYFESFTGEDYSYRIYPNLFFFEVIESFFFPLLLRKWTQKKTKKVNQQAWATVVFGKKVTFVLTKTHKKTTFFGFVFLSSNLQKTTFSYLTVLKTSTVFCQI